MVDLLGCLGAVRILLGLSQGPAVFGIMADLPAFEATTCTWHASAGSTS